MRILFVFSVLPVALCALLGGYRPVEYDSDLKQRLGPVLLGTDSAGLPVVSVFVQLVNGLNYRVISERRNGTTVCQQFYCPFQGNCEHTGSCNSKRSRRDLPESKHLLGGEEPAKQEEMQDVIDFAVNDYNARSNNLYRMVAENVSNLTKQVMIGTHYRFTVNLVSSACRNSNANKGKKLGDCEIASDMMKQQCRFAVLSTWSVNEGFKFTLDDFQCGQLQKVARPVIGGDDHDGCQVHLDAFRNFQLQYKRQYGSLEEEGNRFKVFCANMKRIQLIQTTEQGTATYGVTKFADMSEDEFRKTFLTPKWDLSVPRPWMKTAIIPTDPIPDNFDWRDHNAVTPVKNQGGCGSCWAFSTTGNIEGQWAVHYNQLVSLSEQELVDCDKLDDGCEGGLPSNAYEAIMKLGGLETESDYKYKGVDEKCLFNRSEISVKISGAVNISSNEADMAQWLVKNGPISIGINAFAMQFYMGGISHPWKILCNPNDLDHGVLIVGYGVKNGTPYWIIKNSWGSNWGEKGYYLVYRGSGVCGLNTMCTSATVN